MADNIGMIFKKTAVFASVFVLGAIGIGRLPVAVGANPTTQPGDIQSDTDCQVLITPHFVITIIDHREDEYDITSDHVIYVGTSKSTGKSIRLVGSTLHHICADGSPGMFQGYVFSNGATTYRVYISGDLEIRHKNDEILFVEAGKWVK